MIEWFDETVGEPLAYLDKHDLRKNTSSPSSSITADPGDRRDKKTTARLVRPQEQMSPYDGGIRTPVTPRWPGHTKAGSTPTFVSTVDIAPTILSAAGVTPPKEMHGLSLLDAAAGKGPLKRMPSSGRSSSTPQLTSTSRRSTSRTAGVPGRLG
ncbi:MAG: sulfatase-like hydrolase/transferase [Gemmataceae bacterium]